MAMVDGWPPWLRALRLLHDECGGVFTVLPMMRDEQAAALAAATADEPDPRAYLLAGAITVAHFQIERPDLHTHPMLCLGCTRPLAGVPRSYGVVVPDVPEPTRAVALAVCGVCAPDRDAILSALRPCLRIIWPDLRALGPVMAGAGHA